MMRLSSVEKAAHWLQERVGTASLHTDSRRIQAGDAFIAWPGAATDGRQYVADALKAGASACLVEAEGASAYPFDDARIAEFEGLKAASGLIAAAYFKQPSQSLDVIAVTGTNGKTSTAWWMAQALNLLRKSERSALYSSGLIGTLGIGTPGNMVSTGLTTPDPVMLQAELARLRDAGASACAMEASSIGLAEHRMAGTQIRIAIFTNFTQDHLDYHGTMEAYWLAKRALFDMPGLQTAVINLDDPKSDELIGYCQHRGLTVISTSQLRTDATLCASAADHLPDGMAFEVQEGAEKRRIHCPVIGDFNVANFLGVLGALRALNISLKEACEALSCCTAVPGRMELISELDQPLMVVDYAHTPDALVKALEALRPTARARGGKLWCVFGCGGNRDASKRPLMARAAQNGADQIIVTSDNPRHEAPEFIAEQIMAGFETSYSARQPVLLELDRQRAIQTSAQQAADADVILVAGKGHEDYQEIAGVKHPFSDTSQAQRSLQHRIQQHRQQHKQGNNA
jgi:UDP-N-acetylmuramyl-tripeptide synthetase